MSSNPASILDSVKKALGIDGSDTTFDLDVVIFINSAFGSLLQLGVGPVDGFSITDNTTLWSDYLTYKTLLGMVQNYIIMSVRQVFDPPSNPKTIDAFEKLIQEQAWRINIAAEQLDPETLPLVGVILDPDHNYYWWDLTGHADYPATAISGDLGFDSVVWDVWSKDAKNTQYAFMWDLTGLTDFPADAIDGDLGVNITTGDVWRKVT